MKKFLSVLAVAAALLCSACTPEEEIKETAVTCSWTSSPAEGITANVEVTFTASIEGGTAPYICTWSITSTAGTTVLDSNESSVTYTFTEAGNYAVKLDVEDSKGNKAVKPCMSVVAVAAPVIEDKGDLKISWFQLFGDETGGVRGSAPAIDDAGNVYIATSVSNTGTLRKVSADGKTVDKVDFSAPSNTCGTPSIDNDGNIYVYGGSGAGGGMYKYNSSLAQQWKAEFIGTDSNKAWAVGNASPKLWYGFPVVIGDYVLVANAGTTGTVGMVKASDGTRVSYLVRDDGGSGPSGGCRCTPAISKDGYVWQTAAAKGVCGVQLEAMKAAGAVHYEWFGSAATDGGVLTSTGSDRPMMAVVAIDGVNYAAHVTTAPTGVEIVIIDKANTASKTFLIDGVNTSIANTTEQDQGGVIVGANGEVIVNLKSSGVEDGGIVAIDPKTMTLAWEYRIAESVSAAPALTKEGNIAFGTDDGGFYIIKPDTATKKAELLAKANITEMLTAQGVTFENADVANIKMWSQTTIGDDGKIFIGFQKQDATTQSGLLCLETSACTGPGTSCWPMYGVDRKHSGVQK